MQWDDRELQLCNVSRNGIDYNTLCAFTVKEWEMDLHTINREQHGKQPKGMYTAQRTK